MLEMYRKFSLCIPYRALEEYLLVRARMVWVGIQREHACGASRCYSKVV